METRKKFLDTFDQIILVLVLLCTIGGTIGWVQYFAQTGDIIPLDSALYKSLQLFVFGGDLARPELPVLLNITRFLSPALLATAIIKQLIAATSKQIDSIKIKTHFKDHYVICGLGAVGYNIASDCLTKGTKVVVIEKFAGNSKISEITAQGAIVLTGDATDLSLLKKAALHKAAAIFAVTENDSVNLQIYLQCEACIKKNRKSKGIKDPIRVLVHVAESSTINLVYEGEACKQTQINKADSSRHLFLRPFNINQIATIKALMDFPPDSYYPVYRKTDPPIHTLIVGLGNIGENLLINFARTAHYLCNIPDVQDDETISKKNTVHLVDANAAARLNEISALYPGLEKVVNIVVHSTPTLSLKQEELAALVQEHNIQMAFLCLENDIERFTITHVVQQYQLRNNLQVINIIPTRSTSGMNTLTETVFEKSKQPQENFVQYNIIDKTCKKDLLINETLDRIALHLHGIYNNNNQSVNLEEATRIWAWLPENYNKQSSRFSAEHLPVKLRTLTKGADDPTSNQVKELLAEDSDLFKDLEHIEHIRFVAERMLAGWNRTTRKQESLPADEIKALKALKINKTLCPFHKLSDDERAFNQGFLRIMHELV